MRHKGVLIAIATGGLLAAVWLAWPRPEPTASAPPPDAPPSTSSAVAAPKERHDVTPTPPPALRPATREVGPVTMPPPALPAPGPRQVVAPSPRALAMAARPLSDTQAEPDLGFDSAPQSQPPASPPPRNKPVPAESAPAPAPPTEPVAREEEPGAPPPSNVPAPAAARPASPAVRISRPVPAEPPQPAASLPPGILVASRSAVAATVMQMNEAVPQQFPLMWDTPPHEGPGVATVRFTLDRQGLVSDLALVKSSGHADLDDAAARLLVMGEPYTYRQGWLEVSIAFYKDGEAP